MRTRSAAILGILLAGIVACQQARDDQGSSTKKTTTNAPPASRDTLCWEPFNVPNVEGVPGATAGPRNGSTGSAADDTRRCTGVGMLGHSAATAAGTAGDPRIGMKRTVKCGTGGTCTVKLRIQFHADVFPPPQRERAFVTLRKAGLADKTVEITRNHPGNDFFVIAIDGCGDVDVMIHFQDGGAGTTPGIQGEIAHAEIVEAKCG